MLILESDLRQIAADVFRSLIPLGLTPMEPRVHLARELVAATDVEGSWYNRVEIFADDRAIAAISKASAVPLRPTAQQVRIQFWEICNLLSKIIESSYPKRAANELPVVGRGHIGLNRLPRQSLRTTFECCCYPITVALLDV